MKKKNFLYSLTLVPTVNSSSATENSCCAALALPGPALEGGSVKTGMRAVPGAVERVELKDGHFHLLTIGQKPPQGICGSGIVDMLAQLFLNGWISIQGKFLPEKSPLIHLEEEEYCVTYAPGLNFYQSDIDDF